jgi:hypothetical protein
MWPSRRALAFLAVSWLVWAWVEFHVQTPWGATWGGTDHETHIAQVELFLHHGTSIYRGPVKSLCAPPTAKTREWARENGCPDDDVCQLDAAEARPVCAGWSSYPAPYPPGLLLYSLPDAILHEHSSLSPRVVAGLSIVKYLFFSHVLAWLLYRLLFLFPSGADLFGRSGGWFPRDSSLRWGAFLLLYLELVRWAFAGFYDALALCPLFMAVYFIHKKRPVDSFLAFALAAFLQYRALWYLPIAGVAAIQAMRTRDWATSRLLSAKLALAIVLGLISAGVFVLLLPGLSQFPQTNGVFLLRSHIGDVPYSAADFIAVSVIALVYLARSSCWILFASLLWQSIMILCTPQGAPWHMLFLLPLLLVARLEGGYGPTAVTLAFIGSESLEAFKISPSWGGFIHDLWSSWGR